MRCRCSGLPGCIEGLWSWGGVEDDWHGGDCGVRRWNEQFACDSPTSSAQRVEVAAPSTSRRSINAHFRGWAKARIAAGSTISPAAAFGPMPFTRTYT